jgi:hypothetical protein
MNGGGEWLNEHPPTLRALAMRTFSHSLTVTDIFSDFLQSMGL